jgi:ABC-type oligopeptide transport system substrate-binding subunit
MLAVGVSLLVAAGPATSSSSKSGQASKGALKKGGTLRVDLPVTDIDDIDPSLAYGTTTWHIQYSTALKLLNYPDAAAPRGSRLIPEGASSYRVSKGGRVYTFTIRPGFRFNNGAPVKAANYAFAINRSLGKDLQSPAYQFVADENATNIVGAAAVREGTATKASGVKVKGRKLTITLSKPDATFLSKITMPFFQAMPTSLSRTDKVINVDSGHPLPSAGPYYVAEREPNRLVVIKKNPNYAKGVARTYKRRPANLAQINIKTTVNLEASYQEVRANQADKTYDLPPTAPAELGDEFGTKKGRFRVTGSNCVSYIAMNSGGTGSGTALFRNNPGLRRAVNYVINRQAMVNLSGKYAGQPTDQYLPKGFPGYKELGSKGYPNGGNIPRAKTLANGKVRSGGPWKYYYGLAAPGPQRMELVRSYLSQIGISIDPQGFRGFAIYDAAGKRNSPHAFTTGGWCQDYSDPYDFINVLLYGGALQDENNNNLAYFNNAAYNKRMEKAAKLIGAKRLSTYAALENDLVTKQGPWAAWNQPTNQFFFSNKVDTKSLVYQSLYEEFPFNVMALK